MNVLVFGTTGQVATELAILAKNHNYNFIFVNRHEADLLYPEKCKNIIISHKPIAVINLAAWTDVDSAEDNKEKVFTVNGKSPGAMAEACLKLSIPLIHLSTDYVFDGSGNTPWQPYDALKPMSVYGESKMLGEKLINNSNARAIILRTSWVFSAYGKNFVKTMFDLGFKKNSLNVVGDQFGGPTSASSIAKTVLILFEYMVDGRLGGTYHFSGLPYISWADFAKSIMDKSMSKCKIMPISSSEYPTSTNRPKNSRLDCDSLYKEFSINQPSWEMDLDDVMNKLKEMRNAT